ncbi:hypothetical protein FCJ61_05075 [Burkholderia metallica]|nr:hypothetical protein [Burkholderia metallica]
MAEDVATSRPPTEITAEYQNSVQEELALFIEWCGLVLNKADNTQLRKALVAKFALLSSLDLKMDKAGGTFTGDVHFSPTNRLILPEGSAALPSLTFENDGAPDTGLYHVADGVFAVTNNTIPTVQFRPEGTTFLRPSFGPTPPDGDDSTRHATTAFVASMVKTALIGQIVFEPRTLARAGYLKCNGALVNRADYPKLWAYAQASGTLVTDVAWGQGNFGCFSQGDGASTFRLPELRGEFLRCWDDGRGVDASRGIGTWQGGQNAFHAHGASSGAAGAHGHSAWTDTQGWHGHHGNTAGAGAHSHQLTYQTPQNVGDTDRGSVGSVFSIDNSVQPWTSAVGDHAHAFDTEGAGNHAHNVGIGAVGDHTHAITVNGDGGNEARPRNLALLAMIRAY